MGLLSVLNTSRYRKLVLWTVIYTVIVILWGAWVRISHSGDGCGETWPLCGGQVIPDAQKAKTWVEYTHRLMSGLYGILIFFIFYATRRLFPVGHQTRRMASWLLVFCIIEALLGAKLVLLGLVGNNDSLFRVFTIGVHQINSLLLSGTACLLLLSAYENLPAQRSSSGRAFWKTGFFLIVAMTGSWAALANTLFPSQNLAESWAREFQGDGHAILHLRSLHPVFALSLGLFVSTWAYKRFSAATGFLRQVYFQTSLLWVLGVLFGMMTLLLLSPVWMKLTHLALAHLLWMSLLRLIFIQKQFTP